MGRVNQNLERQTRKYQVSDSRDLDVALLRSPVIRLLINVKRARTVFRQQNEILDLLAPQAARLGSLADAT